MLDVVVNMLVKMNQYKAFDITYVLKFIQNRLQLPQDARLC